MVADLILYVKRRLQKMENLCIRERARAAKVPLWRIAALIGISEPTLIRWLRFPLPPDKESRILEAISTLESESHE